VQAGVPFCAVFEETVREGGQARASSRKICRDRAGRTREEISVTSPTGDVDSVVILVDPATLRFVTLDPKTNRLRADRTLGYPPDLSMLAPTAAHGGTQSPSAGEPRRADLGEQVIVGVHCTGQRSTYKDGWTEEWKAESFDLPLLVRFETAAQAFTRRCRELRLEDPDPALFAALEGP
jgi:hypothetical protein